VPLELAVHLELPLELELLELLGCTNEPPLVNILIAQLVLLPNTETRFSTPKLRSLLKTVHGVHVVTVTNGARAVIAWESDLDLVSTIASNIWISDISKPSSLSLLALISLLPQLILP
jgi:hypothetical protein